MSKKDVQVITKHKLTETVAVSLLGWKWVSYIGRPIKGTPGYPNECRVRRLFSPSLLKRADWIQFFAENDGREADMTEPLSYEYGSSMGPEPLPRVMIFVEER